MMFDEWHDFDSQVTLHYYIGPHKTYLNHEVQDRLDGFFVVYRRGGTAVLDGRVVAGPFESLDAAKAACVLLESVE